MYVLLSARVCACVRVHVCVWGGRVYVGVGVF